ncbi:hypothetical protein HJG60_008469 [Phyllostomus discolor]|uniref:Uncharacterized protein n=1 Tax=Phyllostomus discolor TaxID=89673 RepID=A0A833Z090_9CHIR|nr:hypothetical protein HJG60_008469 [Phyllostomus discolor]
MHIHEDREKAGVLLKKKGQQRPKNLKCSSMSTGAGLTSITHTTHTHTHTCTRSLTPRTEPLADIGHRSRWVIMLRLTSDPVLAQGSLGAMTGPSASTLKKIRRPWPSFPSALGTASHVFLAAHTLLSLLPPCPRFQLSLLKAPLSSFTFCDLPWSQLAQGTRAQLGMTFSVFNNWLSPGAGQGEWLPATSTVETALLTVRVTLERRGNRPKCQHFSCSICMMG